MFTIETRTKILDVKLNMRCEFRFQFPVIVMNKNEN